VDPIALIFSAASFATILRFSDPEIRLTIGSEFVLNLNEAVDTKFEERMDAPLVVSDKDDRQEMARMIRRMPYQTQKELSQFSDLTNLVFVGDKDAVQRAFTAAG